MTKEEREQCVIRLFKEGRTVMDIAGLVRMSFCDIGAITNKAKFQAERERGYNAEDTKPKSHEAHALIIFRRQIPTRSSNCIES
jgi:hypothetical protein